MKSPELTAIEKARRLILDQKIVRLQALGGGEGPPLSSYDQREITDLIHERNMLGLDLNNDDHELLPTLDPERRLWLEVIKRAFNDVNVKILDEDSSSIKNNKERVQNDARAWFTRAGRDFRVICERAGLHHDFVRAVALARMA